MIDVNIGMFDKFEYKLIKFGLHPLHLLTEQFNKLGEDGWEYICNNGDVSIFKRKLKNIINS